MSREAQADGTIAEMPSSASSALLEHAEDGVIAVDEQFMVTGWNCGAERLYGWRAREVLGRDITELVRFELSDGERDDMRRETLESGRMRREVTAFRRDGTPVDIEVINVVVRRADGEITAILGVHRDVTERKRAEARLRESQRRTATVLESITDAFFWLDRDWRITYVNARALQFARSLLGEELTPERVLGRSLWDLVPALAGTPVEDEYRAAMDAQRTAVFEYSHPGGGPVFAVHAYPSEEGLSVYFRDVTEQRRTSDELERWARQQALLAELGVRALESDTFGPLLDEAVDLVSSTLGVDLVKIAELLPSGDLLVCAGVGWRDGVVGQLVERGGSDSEWGYALASGKPVVSDDLVHERRFATAPTALEHGAVSAAGVVIHGSTGPFGILGALSKAPAGFSGQDVDFLQAVANVVASAAERAEAEKRLEEVREVERRRIARDLHDEALRDLGHALAEAHRAYAVAEEPAPRQRLERLLPVLKRAGQHVRGAIYDLRLDGEHERSLGESLERLTALHRAIGEGLEIELAVRAGIPTGPIGRRGVELLRIAGEALTNARRHSGARTINLAAWSAGDTLWLQVTDDGDGFDLGSRSTAGAGIEGMRERAALIGARLEIAGELGAGARVRVGLPLAGESQGTSPIRLLLVEDHAAIREAIAAAFEQEAGFEIVAQASSLGEARTMLEEIDVAVLDLGLPDGYGGDLIEELRDASPQAAALVLTATPERTAVARAVESGAAAVLDKTVHLDEVVRAVRRVRAGETLLPPGEVVELLQVAGRRREQEEADRAAIARLSTREREVLQALADGLDSQAIADRLHISVRTERNHAANILAKLGVHSQLQALVFALRYGVAEIPR